MGSVTNEKAESWARTYQAQYAQECEARKSHLNWAETCLGRAKEDFTYWMGQAQEAQRLAWEAHTRAEAARASLEVCNLAAKESK